MGLVVFLSPNILFTELKDTGVYVESYTSLHLLHYPGVDLLHQSQLRTEPQLHPNALVISCLGEVAAYASQDITSDKAHKKKKKSEYATQVNLY